jgi:ubiquinone/menaquinone biosynthesis C-methylase UbiE
MKIFENNYFDFILFSWNGIDTMSHDDRLKVLQEIIRVGNEGGLFCFSSHNLQNFEEGGAILSSNPIRMSWRTLRYFLITSKNKDFKKLKNKKYAVIKDLSYIDELFVIHYSPNPIRMLWRIFKLLNEKDGAHMFENYYIKPVEQIKQLKDLGFKNIKIYSLDNGNEIKDLSKLDSLTDMYLYYLCNI